MKILLLARLKNGTGNNSTAARIGHHLISDGNEVQLKCESSFKDSGEFDNFVHLENINIIFGIHAYRAGRLLIACSVPYIIVFGGTDLNEHYESKDILEIMTKAVTRAKRCIAFNKPLKQKAISLWKDAEGKILLQPQAVEISASNAVWNFDDIRHMNTQFDIILNNNAIVFLLVAGLRPVKDPLFLAETFAEWHKTDDRIYLMIVGPEIDKEYAKECKDCLDRYQGIAFINELASEDLESAMRKAFAVINTSKSEGMANAVLEAMSFGTPVIARNIDGNAAVIKHRKTGLLFDTPKEFKELASELLLSESLKDHLIKNAKEYISREHSVEKERETYCKLVNSICQ
eukprot:Seg796.2 transcript_id=Seg796.2/GoldUCD/mRNA.D3Y31 product="Glycosyltransferase 1 domain-containing protein 1" protein_id=Seg796.2/GoldUCD/D3Y31